jgi:succinyl-CoA synthetase beta subunit
MQNDVEAAFIIILKMAVKPFKSIFWWNCSLRELPKGVDAYKTWVTQLKVPIIVRIYRTNAEIAEIKLDNSGMPILSAITISRNS